MLYLSRREFERMLEHARAQLPEEACGMLGGRTDEAGNRVIERVYLLENLDHSPERFRLAPEEQLAAVREMRASGWSPLGSWHSHPDTPAWPSREDRRLAYDDQASYLILSLIDRDEPVLNAFRIRDDAVMRERIVWV